MQIAVFGATGRLGRHVLAGALARGLGVSVLVRDAKRLTASGPALIVREGAIDDPAALRATLAGADAAICCLAAGNGLLTRFAAAVVPLLELGGPRRLVVLAGASLRQPGDPAIFSLGLMATMMRLVPGRMLADVQGLADRLATSDLDWTIVRSANHSDGPDGGVHAATAFPMRLSAAVPRAALAGFMLDLAADHRFVRQMPMVEGAAKGV